MNQTMGGIKPTIVSEGLGGNSFNSTHLVNTYGIGKPHSLSANAEGIAMLFSATDRYQDKPIIGMTEAKGKKTYLTNEHYTWKLKGHKKQKLRVREVVETSSYVGANGQPFKVILDKPWFKYPDVLQPESNKYPLEIVRVMPRGLNFEYTLKILDDSNTKGMPAHLIGVGQEFMKVSTNIGGEDNQDYGTMQFNSVFELASFTGAVAEKVQFTDKMLRQDKNSGSEKNTLSHWRVPFHDNKGKTYYNFMPMAEAEVWNNIYEDIEWGLNFSRKAIGKSPQGYAKLAIAGLRQQQEYGNNMTHNGNLTLTALDEWINAIYRGRKDATAPSRKLVLMTGEMGALMFDQMVASEASSFLTIDSHFISGKDPRHLAFGAQFTQYRGKNGLDITVMLNPHYDNPDYCPETHPLFPDTTIDSWRMDILDFGSTAEQGKIGTMSNNIEMVCEKWFDTYFVSTGKWDRKSGMPINNGGEGLAGGTSGYSMQVEKSFGLLIRDISRLGSIQYKMDL